jgi:hypothetical protein
MTNNMNLPLCNFQEDEAQNTIKLALQTMMLLQRNAANSSITKVGDVAESSKNTLKRAASDNIDPPAKKQRQESCSDDALDQAADEVSPVTEWERIMADWNPEKECLPFQIDTLLIESQ